MKSIPRIIILITVWTAFINSGSRQEERLRISRLTENYYVYTTYRMLNDVSFPSNGMYVITDSGVVLFDTPWDTTQFQPLLDSISVKHGKQVVLCIATHYHDDRTAGLEYFRTHGISTYSSKLTLDLCAKHGEKQSEFFFNNDTVFTVGTKRFHTHYPGAGHTKDNIVIWCPEEKILYGGCLVKSTENKSLGNIADADLNAWPRTMKSLLNRYGDAHYVIPGHFGWENKNSLRHTIRLLKKAN